MNRNCALFNIHILTHQNKTMTFPPKIWLLGLSFLGRSVQSIHLNVFNFWTSIIFKN